MEVEQVASTETLTEQQRRTIDDAIRTGKTPLQYWREQHWKLRAIEKAQQPATVREGSK